MKLNDALLIDTVTPYIVSFTSDNIGGYTKSESASTTFRGRLSSMPVDERMSADKTTVYATHRLYCHPQSFTEKDRLKIGSRYFEVKGIVNPSNLSDFWQCDLLEID